MKVLYFTIILCVLIVSFINTNTGPEHNINNKSFGHYREDISTLLDRIEWANNYNGRINILPRFLFSSVITVILLSVFLCQNFPNFMTFFQCVFICYIVNRSLYFYCIHHSDKFVSCGIFRNVKILRKKLGLKKGETKNLTKKLNYNLHYSNFIYDKNRN